MCTACDQVFATGRSCNSHCPQLRQAMICYSPRSATAARCFTAPVLPDLPAPVPLGSPPRKATPARCSSAPEILGLPSLSVPPARCSSAPEILGLPSLSVPPARCPSAPEILGLRSDAPRPQRFWVCHRFRATSLATAAAVCTSCAAASRSASPPLPAARSTKSTAWTTCAVALVIAAVAHSWWGAASRTASPSLPAALVIAAAATVRGVAEFGAGDPGVAVFPRQLPKSRSSRSSRAPGAPPPQLAATVRQTAPGAPGSLGVPEFAVLKSCGTVQWSASPP